MRLCRLVSDQNNLFTLTTSRYRCLFCSFSLKTALQTAADQNRSRWKLKVRAVEKEKEKTELTPPTRQPRVQPAVSETFRELRKCQRAASAESVCLCVCILEGTKPSEELRTSQLAFNNRNPELLRPLLVSTGSFCSWWKRSVVMNHPPPTQPRCSCLPSSPLTIRSRATS